MLTSQMPKLISINNFRGFHLSTNFCSSFFAKSHCDVNIRLFAQENNTRLQCIYNKSHSCKRNSVTKFQINRNIKSPSHLVTYTKNLKIIYK